APPTAVSVPTTGGIVPPVEALPVAVQVTVSLLAKPVAVRPTVPPGVGVPVITSPMTEVWAWATAPPNAASGIATASAAATANHHRRASATIRICNFPLFWWPD